MNYPSMINVQFYRLINLTLADYKRPKDFYCQWRNLQMSNLPRSIIQATAKHVRVYQCEWAVTVTWLDLKEKYVPSVLQNHLLCNLLRLHLVFCALNEMQRFPNPSNSSRTVLPKCKQKEEKTVTLCGWLEVKNVSDNIATSGILI